MEINIPTVTCGGQEVKLREAFPIKAPTSCPVCGCPVGKRQGVSGADSVNLYCLNPACPAQQLGKIKTWVKKLDIQGLGDVFIEELVAKGMVKSVADLYKIGPFILSQVMGDARARKTAAEIDKKRNLTLSDFLGSLGIEGLGRRRVILVQQALPGEFDTLEDWLSGDLVAKADKVGLPNAAAGIYRQITAAFPLIQDLLAAGVTIKESVTEKPTKKEGSMTFCITGKLSEPKAVFHEKIQAAGHSFTETYSKTIDYLVAADPNSGSSKMKKAAKDGVKVISEDELLALIYL